MDDIAIVITGAAPIAPRALASIPPGAIVIAADGALDHALRSGLQPAALVGDLDSVSADGLAWAEAHARIERHDPDKDVTDTEIALRTAAEFAPARLTLISGGGDRLDHTFAAIGALGHPSLTSVPNLDGWWGDERFSVVHGPGRLRVDLPVGTTVSLLALHGPCTGVRTDGLRWPLVDADLPAMAGLGVSNEVVADVVDVSVTAGVLTVFIADHLAPRETP